MTTHIPFSEVIGQTGLIRELTFLVDGYKATGTTDNLLFSAAKGLGKSFIAREFGRNLTRPDGKIKRFIEVNAASLSVDDFFNSIVIPYMIDNYCTCFIDEIHTIKKPLESILLSVLAPNRENVNTVIYDGVPYIFNFNFVSFITATTNAERISLPLKDRLTRVEFDEYTKDELTTILKKNLKSSVEFKDNVLDLIAPVLRSNPRLAVRMAKRIGYYGAKYAKNEFGTGDWEKLKYHLNIQPLGLSKQEIQALRAISEFNGITLTHLSAKLNLNSATVRTDIEPFLLSSNLMKVDTKRFLTRRGQKVLGLIKTF